MTRLVARARQLAHTSLLTHLSHHSAQSWAESYRIFALASFVTMLSVALCKQHLQECRRKRPDLFLRSRRSKHTIMIFGRFLKGGTAHPQGLALYLPKPDGSCPVRTNLLVARPVGEDGKCLRVAYLSRCCSGSSQPYRTSNSAMWCASPRASRLCTATLPTYQEVSIYMATGGDTVPQGLQDGDVYFIFVRVAPMNQFAGVPDSSSARPK